MVSSPKIPDPPPPPPDPLEDEEALAAARERQRDRRRLLRNQGVQSMFLTGPLGLRGEPQVSRPTLLGG